MKKISDKYTIYGRKKGRKKIDLVDKDFVVNYKINIEKDIKKNKKNIIDVGSGNGENTLFLAKKTVLGTLTRDVETAPVLSRHFLE